MKHMPKTPTLEEERTRLKESITNLTHEIDELNGRIKSLEMARDLHRIARSRAQGELEVVERKLKEEK